MAVDSPPLITRERKFAFAIETTTGTKATLAAANAVTRCFDPDIKYDFDKIDRPTNSMIPQGSRLGQRRATVSFGTECWSATTLPKWTDLLRGCGYSDAAVAKVFKPVFPSIATISFGLYRAGRFKAAIGCAGTGKLTVKNNEPWRWDWIFTGLADVPDSSTTVTGITYDDTAPIYGAATFSIGTGSAITVPSVEIDLGNTVTVRGDITGVDSAGNKTGGRSGYITQIKPMVKINPEGLSLASRDWFAAHRNYTDIAMSLVGGTSGSPNACTITAAKLRVDDTPDETDDNGMLRDTINLMATDTDYLVIDFTALP